MKSKINKLFDKKYTSIVLWIIIFVILGLVTIYSKKIEKRKVSPIILILLSAVLGIIFYS